MVELLISILFIAIVCLIILLFLFYRQNQRLHSEMNNRAQAQFLSWREREYDSICLRQREIAVREANTQLQEWMLQSEGSIRNDAIQKSQSAIIGKVTEHVSPFLPNFQFNPKDVRFIGSPIDLVIFDGMNDGTINKIIFVEVKTGASAALSKRERQIRNAVENNCVQWLEFRIDREVH